MIKKTKKKKKTIIEEEDYNHSEYKKIDLW